MQDFEIVLTSIFTSTIILLLLVSFIINILFHYKKKQIDHLKEIELIKTNYEKELLKTQLEIQEQTFQHISLELHDNVGHFVSLAKLHLTTLNLNNHLEMTEKIDASVLLLGFSLDEIRNISKSMNAENIISNGLIKTVEQQIDQIQKSGRFVVHFEITGKTCYMDDQKEIVLFRIIQESLNNIVRHSRANKISILLHYDENSLFLTISDNGIGFNVTDILEAPFNKSCGLKNIIKRSVLINARYEILSTPETGTTIKVITPYLQDVCQEII